MKKWWMLTEQIGFCIGFVIPCRYSC